MLPTFLAFVKGGHDEDCPGHSLPLSLYCLFRFRFPDNQDKRRKLLARSLSLSPPPQKQPQTIGEKTFFLYLITTVKEKIIYLQTVCIYSFKLTKKIPLRYSRYRLHDSPLCLFLFVLKSINREVFS